MSLANQRTCIVTNKKHSKNDLVRITFSESLGLLKFDYKKILAGRGVYFKKENIDLLGNKLNLIKNRLKVSRSLDISLPIFDKDLA